MPQGTSRSFATVSITRGRAERAAEGDSVGVGDPVSAGAELVSSGSGSGAASGSLSPQPERRVATRVGRTIHEASRLIRRA